ncbi:glycine/D-amino acid oxidase-like deaminating enzyme [Dongia mobilis]|uniref:Glycine/D-amino acid oxidase-like deaminating enzyme n=1 Tax=Dongia mobilis TaxID=578943 RepID=A0A4R6WSD7_9PROT|nr:FAD-binding oxidoreductase [Dongia mobilis]TDQ84426.1 glycine/D-amino acid oxidase-like deaminating enzyme [Dongia mobilis]
MTSQPIAPNALPERADIVIIGAGIQGCATAYCLAKAGMKVVLIDKSRVAAQQSSRAWGFVRVQMRDPDEIPLMQAGKEIWRGLEAELNADLEWNQGGALYVTNRPATMAYREKWYNDTRGFGLDSRLLSPAEVGRLLPGMTNPNIGGLYTESDGHAEPRKVALAFALRARDLGAAVLEGCGALDIERSGGRVSGVVTEWGTVRADKVMVSAGASSWRILKRIGIFLPQSWIRASVARTNILPHLTNSAFVGDNVAFRMRKDGSFNIASSLHGDVDLTLDHIRLAHWYWRPYLDSKKGIDLHVGAPMLRDLAQRLPWRDEAKKPAIHEREPLIPPVQNRLKDAVSVLQRDFPAIGRVGIAEQWAGNIDSLPDGIPVLDAPADHPGLLIATGFCGHGFALGPVVGKVMSDLALGRANNLVSRAFRLSRFAEGDVKQPMSIW